MRKAVSIMDWNLKPIFGPNSYIEAISVRKILKVVGTHCEWFHVHVKKPNSLHAKCDVFLSSLMVLLSAGSFQEYALSSEDREDVVSFLLNTKKSICKQMSLS
jgi:hypothetical protein